MAFSGLFARKREGDGSTLLSFTIVTTAANEDVEPLHNRMPLILASEAWDSWLVGSAEEAPRTGERVG